jgi:mannosyltransferase
MTGRNTPPVPAQTAGVASGADTGRAAAGRDFDGGPVWMRVLPPLVMLAMGLWNLTGASYWRDEAATLTAVERPFSQLIRMLGHVDGVQGLYYILLWPLVRLAGTGEFVTRFPSVLAMTVAAGMVAALGRRLVSPVSGLAAGLIFAILPQISRYGQEARSYAIVVALAAIASYLLVRAISTTGRRRGWLAGYAVCIGLLGDFDFFTLLLAAAHAVTVALIVLREDGSGRISLAALRGEAGRDRRSLAAGWLAAVAVAVVLASPMLVLGYEQRKAVGWIKTPNLATVTGTFRLVGPFGMVAGGCLIVACGLVISARSGRAGLRAAWPRRLGELCLPWLILPPVVLIGVSFLYPVYTARYVLYCLPALAILAGAGVAALVQAIGARPDRAGGAGLTPLGWVTGAAALVAIAALGFGAQLGYRAPDGHGDNIRGADRIVAAARQPGDAVIYVGLDAKYFPAAYPYGLAQLDPVDQGKTPAQAGNLAGTMLSAAVVRQRLAGVSRVWFVSGGAEPRAAVLRGLGFVHLRTWQIGTIWLALYQHARP